MTDRDSYAPGTPNWIDVSSPDVDATVAFYRDLFGWDCVEPGPADQTGGYRMFQLRGRDVAGIGPHAPDNPAPPMWTTYIAADDADKTAELVSANGGTLLVEPMDVLTAGRMFVAADPTGAVFSVWQPDEHPGAGICNEPGSLSWNELNTRHPETAIAFYEAVFGWTHETDDLGGGAGTYTVFAVDGNQIGGMIDMRGRVPDEIPAHWLTYFAVDDADAALARAAELGGAVLVPAMDIPPGRFGVAADPNGAFFAVMKMTAV